ncbi:MAG TPA: hypothetical protein VHW44_03175 [Pseudonocardiaceae bacterium]|nr:hypothetical protein [Pseudonocardiaceae bacterium]
MRVLTSSRKNTGSESKQFEPPPASSWAEPLEFYLDENAVTRTVRRLLTNLGYQVRTPAEVFGTRAAALGALDEDWLAKVAHTGWVVLNRDAKIMERPNELAAYRAAKIHMFYLPGEATSATLHRLLEQYLRDIITCATGRRPQVWRITPAGVVSFRR